MFGEQTVDPIKNGLNTQDEHDDASWTWVQTISADHAYVPHFSQKSDDYLHFSVFFHTQLVHNDFYSSLKSPLLGTPNSEINN